MNNDTYLGPIYKVKEYVTIIIIIDYSILYLNIYYGYSGKSLMFA